MLFPLCILVDSNAITPGGVANGTLYTIPLLGRAPDGFRCYLLQIGLNDIIINQTIRL